MKVSKPVLVFAIVMLLISGYIFFFTGKKKPKTTVAAPSPVQTTAQSSSQAHSAPTGTPPQQTASPETTLKNTQTGDISPIEKPRFDVVKTAWIRNPFLLPNLPEPGKKATSPGSRLSAIFEKGRDRVAIIDHEVVRKGDMVGNEKVFEIGKDSVTLARNGLRRILPLTGIENAPVEEKSKTTEKGK